MGQYGTDGEAAGLADLGGGVFATPNARIIDRSGRKRFALGDAEFSTAAKTGIIVDKTMLIADVLDSGYKVTLFCRPRRFGKTLNMTMMKAFLEAPEAGGLPAEETHALFVGTDVWNAADGAYQHYLGAYPVVHLSFSTVKKASWADSLAEIRLLMAAEYARHAYLREQGSPLLPEEIDFFNAIVGGTASDADFAGSLAALCRMLSTFHGTGVVVLIDEYDAPVMAGYTYGYYDQVVGFLKGWLTGELKDGGPTLAFACLTGVQRISKESIFSDLNKLYVSTPLNTKFDERYGFIDDEVRALLEYTGHPGSIEEARSWYDGYRFGNNDVYNPWSVINYLDSNCSAGTYWLNTSSNSVVGELIAEADEGTLADVYGLMEPGGVVEEPLDLGVVFPDMGVREGALWSMLYLSGYVTTGDVDDPSDETRLRPLRIPDYEVSRIFNNEIVARFRTQAGGSRQLASLQRALVMGDSEAFARELGRIALRASAFDLTSENSCHMLLMGLLFGVPGYRYPLSNREAGHGRYDIRLEPDPHVHPRPGRFGVMERRPLVTIEVKFLKPSEAPKESDALDTSLRELADAGLEQIGERGYDADVPKGACGRLRWGVAFSGKHVAAVCDRA